VEEIAVIREVFSSKVWLVDEQAFTMPLMEIKQPSSVRQVILVNLAKTIFVVVECTRFRGRGRVKSNGFKLSAEFSYLVCRGPIYKMIIEKVLVIDLNIGSEVRSSLYLVII
jgi:hypothetical protein